VTTFPFLAYLRTFCLISVCLLARVVRSLSAQLAAWQALQGQLEEAE
jgi:hypothetical protein